jgi:hypothetical protein
MEDVPPRALPVRMAWPSGLVGFRDEDSHEFVGGDAEPGNSAERSGMWDRQESRFAPRSTSKTDTSGFSDSLEATMDPDTPPIRSEDV